MLTIFLLPLIAVAVIVAPIVLAVVRAKNGKRINAKRTVLANIMAFAGCMLAMGLMFPLGIAAEGANAVAAATSGISDGLRYLGAGLATGLGSIGAGIAVGGAAPAAIGAISEDEKNMPKALIFVALGEGVAIYGLLVSILLIFVAK
jgi:V/A-type H+-transporting ATPase subunit K